MSLINPFSNSSAFACSTTAECNTNFPSLKHFFPCEERSDDHSHNTLTDRAGGVVLSGVTSLNNADGIQTLTGNFNAVTGDWTNPAGKNILILFCGKPAVSQNPLFILGKVNTTGAGVDTGIFVRMTNATTANGKSRVNITSGGTSLNADTTNWLAGDGSLRSYALAVNWASTTGLKQHDFDGTTINAGGARTAVDINTTMSAGVTTTFTAQTSSIASSAFPGNIQVWHFTTMPSDAAIQAALAWTHAQLASLTSTTLDDIGNPQGLKLVYPGFSKAYYA